MAAGGAGAGMGLLAELRRLGACLGASLGGGGGSAGGCSAGGGSGGSSGDAGGGGGSGGARAAGGKPPPRPSPWHPVESIRTRGAARGIGRRVPTGGPGGRRLPPGWRTQGGVSTEGGVTTEGVVSTEGHAGGEGGGADAAWQEEYMDLWGRGLLPLEEVRVRARS